MYQYLILSSGGVITGEFATVDFSSLPTGDTYSLDYTTNPDDVYLDINGPTSVGSPAPERPSPFPLS